MFPDVSIRWSLSLPASLLERRRAGSAEALFREFRDGAAPPVCSLARRLPAGSSLVSGGYSVIASTRVTHCAALGTPPRSAAMPSQISRAQRQSCVRRSSIAKESRFENGPTLRRFFLRRKGNGS